MRKLFTLVICCLLASVSLLAQQVSPFQGLGQAQFFDNNGQILTAGVLYTYQAGTTNQLGTYTDSTGTVLNPNPLPFGSGARVAIWLLSGSYYKFVLCVQNDGPFCAPGDVLFSVDQVPGNPAGVVAGNTFTGTFISSSANPATTGILRLATGDAICWRNQANTANLCISKDTSDVLTWAGSAMKFSEATCSNAGVGLDYICADSSTHHWKFTGNGSAQFILPGLATAATAGDFASFATNGIDIIDSNVSSTAPSFNQITIDGVNWTGTSSIGDCLMTPSSATAAAWATCPPSFNAPQRVTLSSPVSVSGGTQTVVLSELITFPTATGNYRADIQYNAWVGTGITNFCAAEVIDTTNNRAFAGSGQNTNSSASLGYSGISAAELSSQTYPAGATATFTLQVECGNATSVSANMTHGAIFTMSPAEPTYLTVTPVLSN